MAEAARFGAVLASHDDTTAEQVAISARHGAHFAEFPTTLEAAPACRAQGIKVMMGAPNLIRGGSHSGNVAASTGWPRPICWTSCRPIMCRRRCCRRRLMLGDLWGDVARGVRTVTSAPAQAVGLTDRGLLELGARADVIRVARVASSAALRGTWVQGKRVG